MSNVPDRIIAAKWQEYACKCGHVFRVEWVWFCDDRGAWIEGELCPDCRSPIVASELTPVNERGR